MKVQLHSSLESLEGCINWNSWVSLILWGEGACLALVGHPSSDGIMIKIPYGVGVLLHQPSLHPIFSYWDG